MGTAVAKNETDDTLITTDEVARRLGIHVETVRLLVGRGELPAVRVGRIFRFDPADVRAYIEKNKK